MNSTPVNIPKARRLAEAASLPFGRLNEAERKHFARLVQRGATAAEAWEAVLLWREEGPKALEEAA